MSTYQGGKTVIGKHIANEIKKYITEDEIIYVPFFGIGGVSIHFNNKIYGSDINSDLMELNKKIKSGYKPPEYVSKQAYLLFRDNPEILNHIPYYRGFVSIFCSYNSKYWGAYASKRPNGKNYIGERSRGLVKRGKLFKEKDINLESKPYQNLNVKDSVIYCDPPYKGTFGYNKMSFNHDEFYQWCYKMKDNNNKIFISEYDMPDKFIKIWERKRNSTFHSKKTKKVVEKLYML